MKTGFFMAKWNISAASLATRGRTWSHCVPPSKKPLMIISLSARRRGGHPNNRFQEASTYVPGQTCIAMLPYSQKSAARPSTASFLRPLHATCNRKDTHYEGPQWMNDVHPRSLYLLNYIDCPSL